MYGHKIDCETPKIMACFENIISIIMSPLSRTCLRYNKVEMYKNEHEIENYQHSKYYTDKTMSSVCIVVLAHLS